MYSCPCGNFQSDKECTCSLQTATRYQKRISGPMLDRVDIHIEVPRVDFEKLSDSREKAQMKFVPEWKKPANVSARFSALNNGVMTSADICVE